MIPKPKRIAITPEQARHLLERVQAADAAQKAADAAKAAAGYTLAVLIAGHVHPESALVALDVDEGWLTVQAPEVPDPVPVGVVDETGG